MTCANCGQPMLDEANFCVRCGAPRVPPVVQESPVQQEVIAKPRLKQPKCPYCGVVLDPVPKGKKKCLACKQYIYVRTEHGRTKFLTEEGRLKAIQAQEEREKKAWQTRLDREWVSNRRFWSKELLRQKRGGFVTHVRISAVKDSRTCEKCKGLDGQVFTLDEALEKMPLPVRCADDFCRCAYTYE